MINDRMEALLVTVGTYLLLIVYYCRGVGKFGR